MPQPPWSWPEQPAPRPYDAFRNWPPASWPAVPSPPLTQAQDLTVLPAFHPLWARIPPRELARTDDRGAQGNFRTYAQLTAHIIDTVLTDPLACSGSALLARAWYRLKGA
ncbi:hypothetical protein ACWGKU_17100 [Kitasatospora sp. NPDC054768]